MIEIQQVIDDIESYSLDELQRLRGAFFDRIRVVLTEDERTALSAPDFRGHPMSVQEILKDIDEFTPEDLRELQTAVTKRLEALESEADRERQFDEELVRRGIISSILDRSKSTPLDQRPPAIRVEGTPLSEIIIQERR